MIKYKTYIPLVLFAILGVLSFFVIKPLLLPLFVGALLAYIASPVYQWFFSKTKNRTVAASIVCFLVLLVLIVPAFFFTKTLVEESYILFLLVKQRLSVGLFTGCENAFCEGIKNLGQDTFLGAQIQDVSKSITNWIIEKGSNFLISIPGVLLNLFVIFFTMFYFLRDGKKFVAWLHDLVSMQEKRYHYVSTRLKEILHGVVYGYILVALVQGAFGALGFWLFGVPSPLFWGGIMAFLALIPYIGTGLIWIPAAAIMVLDGVFQNTQTLVIKGIGLFVYSFIFVSGSDNVLRPKLMGHKAKIHPSVVLVGILGGVFLFGILGVILGPLILSLTTVFIDSYLRNRH